MSKTLPIGAPSKVISQSSVVRGQLEQSRVNNDAMPISITAGMILRRTVSTELPVISKSLNTVPMNRFTFFLSSLFATVLEDVITQIWLLETCNNELAVIRTMSDYNYLKAVKYGVCDPNEVKDELDGIDPRNLNCLIYKVRKLVADRKFIKDLMTSTYISLALSFTFFPLANGVNSIMEVQRYRNELWEEESKNRMIRKDVCRQVRQQRNHYKSVLYDTQAVIDKLRTKVEDSVLYSEVRSRYMDNWQVARTEQHKQKIIDTEYGSSSTIEYYKKRFDHEVRVHTEVETLVSIVINETLAKVDEWMNKFDTDMEAQDLKIAVMKNKYQDALNNRVELEKTYATHEVLQNNWIQFKKERQAAIDYRNKMTNSAIVVQAWWRGLLVRLQIGPYKPSKKPKGKKKKE